jgi:hypothetical protein
MDEPDLNEQVANTGMLRVLARIHSISVLPGRLDELVVHGFYVCQKLLLDTGSTPSALTLIAGKPSR